MQDLERAIVATLGYYYAFELPMTSHEIFSFLIQPTRLVATSSGVVTNSDCSLSAILRALKQLHTRKIIWQENGYYALRSAPVHWYNERIHREKIAAQKWRRLERLIRYLRWVPFTRMIMVSGSLSLDAADQTSDYDLIIVAASGRIAVCRLIMVLAAQLLGVRRTRHDRVAPDKLCFNHFVSEDHLAMAHQSLYTAQTYARAVVVFDRGGTAQRWIAANTWIRRWVRNWHTLSTSTRRTIPTHAIIEAAVRGSEQLFAWLGGRYIERAVLALQAWRARRHDDHISPSRATEPGRVIVTAHEMEFHPRSIERAILDRYHATLQGFGITHGSREPDSGLE